MKEQKRIFLTSLFVGLAAASAFAQDASKRGASIQSSSDKAQSEESAFELKKGTNEFGFWQGGAFNAVSGFSGLDNSQTKGQRLVIAGLRYGRTLASNKLFSFEYTIDVIPVAVTLGTFVKCPEDTNPACYARTVDRRERASAYGFGVAPIGLKLYLLPKKRVKPFVDFVYGLLFFDKAVPVPDATKLNYTIEPGVGAQIMTRSQRAFTIGYKFHHISNAAAGKTNPGLNTNLFYFGYSFFKK